MCEISFLNEKEENNLKIFVVLCLIILILKIERCNLDINPLGFYIDLQAWSSVVYGQRQDTSASV